MKASASAYADRIAGALGFRLAEGRVEAGGRRFPPLSHRPLGRGEPRRFWAWLPARRSILSYLDPGDRVRARSQTTHRNEGAMRRNATGDGGDDTQHRPRALPLGRTRWAIAGAAFGVVGSSWVGVGHHWPKATDAPAGVAETAEGTDGTIDGAVRKVSDGIQATTTTVRDGYDRMRGASRNVALVAAVNARLRQDKSLDSDRIDVSVADEGTVILKGQVPDVASKEMAVDLTRDIRGVVQVEDHLAIPPKARVIAAASDDDPATPARSRRTR